MLCPGSANAEQGLPDTESPDSERGSRLHDVMKTIALQLAAGKKVADIEYEPLEMDDDRMVVTCIEKFETVIRGFYGTVFMDVEKQFSMPFLGDDVFGTLDWLVYQPFGKGYLRDYKFGFSPVTPATHNLQLRAYALAAMTEYELQECVVDVSQPARDWQTTRTYYAADVAENIAGLKAIIDAARKPDAPLIPGKKQCQYCKAKAQCPALVWNAKQLVTKAEPKTLADYEIAELLPIAESVEKWCGALKQQAFLALSAGRKIDGYHLTDSLKHRSWKDQTKATEQLEKVVAKPALFHPAELKSPAQIEKLIGKAKKMRELMESLTERLPGDKRIERIES